MNYEEKVKVLTPERKLELWDKVKNLDFSNKTKFAIIYYESISKGYITKNK